MRRFAVAGGLAAILAPALLLSACGQKSDPTLGGLTQDQADGMNAAAASLDRGDNLIIGDNMTPIDPDSSSNQSQD